MKRGGAIPTLGAETEPAGQRPLPFMIMTSGDTHDATQALLDQNDYFGLKREQVSLRAVHSTTRPRNTQHPMHPASYRYALSLWEPPVARCTS